jgi:16S rRNA (uracil1498-N3)-methyltransferase
VKTPRFYCPDLIVGDVALDAAQSRHALASLRLADGDAVRLFDGQGKTSCGVIVSSGVGRKRNRVVRIAVETVECSPVPLRSLALICAGCKGPRLTWMVEKCTELGVTSLVLAEFERSVVRLGEGRAEKLRGTAIEACKQSGRDRLPTIRAGGTAEQALCTVPFDHLAIAHPQSSSPSIAEWFGEVVSASRLTVVIGPEGGLSDDEVDRFVEMGGRVVVLSENILRVETAAVAATAVWAARAAPASRDAD